MRNIHIAAYIFVFIFFSYSDADAQRQFRCIAKMDLPAGISYEVFAKSTVLFTKSENDSAAAKEYETLFKNDQMGWLPKGHVVHVIGFDQCGIAEVYSPQMNKRYWTLITLLECQNMK